jgi:heme/copper-type cytochrome/quinol oxidase subunit 2
MKNLVHGGDPNWTTDFKGLKMQEFATKLIINIFCVILIVIGLVEVIFLKKLSKYAMDRWYKDFKIRMNKAIYVIVVLVTGLLFIIVGTRLLFFVNDF